MDVFLFGEKLGKLVLPYPGRGSPSGIEYCDPVEGIFKSPLKKNLINFCRRRKSGLAVLHNIFYSKNGVLEIQTVPACVANSCHWPIFPTGERQEPPASDLPSLFPSLPVRTWRPLL